jgi:uncharacterized protein (DUF302 family)
MRTRDSVVVGVAVSIAVVAALGTFALIQSVREIKEPTMNSSDLADADLVTLPSSHGASETVARLKALLDQKKIQVFAHIDHAAEAKKVGMSLRPTQVLIFGNPRAGTPLMQSQQTIGLDLPLRVLVWEDGASKVWLTYRRPERLAQRHHIVGHDESVKALDTGLAGLARAATAP